MTKMRLLILFLGFVGEHLAGGRPIRCQQYDNSECYGDICTAVLYFSGPNSYRVTEHSCVSDLSCALYPHTKVNITIESTPQNYFFPRVFFGCCDSEDFCNQDISKLLLPDEYYQYTARPVNNHSTISPSSSESEPHILPSVTMDSFPKSSSMHEGPNVLSTPTKRAVRCQQNDSECSGDFCTATVRLSELGGYHIIDQSCVSGSLCISYPHVRVNYTDNGTLQEFLFGCCESEDFCNRHISKLLFPDEYYVDINLIPASRKRKIKSSISQSDHDILQLKSSSPRTLSSVKCNNTQSSQNIPTFTNVIIITVLSTAVLMCAIALTLPISLALVKMVVKRRPVDDFKRTNAIVAIKLQPGKGEEEDQV